MTLLEARGIKAGYGPGNTVLHGVDISLDASGVTALTGVNGAGKTTLASALAGRIPITGGSLRHSGEDVATSSLQHRVSRGIVLCPQGREVFPDLTVHENLRVGSLTIPKADRGDMIDQVMAELPILKDFLDTKAGSLSGGQQQLLALGRAVIAQPKVLLVDEPSMGLAPGIVDTVYAYLRTLHARGVALLVIEESPLRLVGLADQVLVMRRGEIIREGGAELLQDEAVLTSALLGEGTQT